MPGNGWISAIGEHLQIVDYLEKHQKEYGEIRNLSDMAAYLPKHCQIKSGDYRELSDAEVLVITASGRICDEDRLKELWSYEKIIQEKSL